MHRLGLEAVLVYADREHYANAAYLTGFDPRFEEAVVLIRHRGDPAVLAGNESVSLCSLAGLPVNGVLCQSFSLPSQDRRRRRRLADALAEAGLGRGERTGIIGWKPIPYDDAPAGPYRLAVPQFVLSEVESHLHDAPVDATALLCGLDGLRAHCEADQLALNEHRAARASQCVWRAIEGLEIGSSELEVSSTMRLAGLPLSCHVMCTSGSGRLNGLASPSDRRIGHGDSFSAAVGFWGGLCCRAGLVMEAGDASLEPFVERFARPYFEAVRTWYQSIRIGVSGGDLTRAVGERLRGTGVRAMLNPGHLTHLDEWFDSPFTENSGAMLVSGTALQCDIIPVSDAHSGYSANCEDGLALADGDLRDELRTRFPQMWKRVERRRRFMTESLGLDIREEVLPFSDRQGALAPALLSPGVVLTA